MLKINLPLAIVHKAKTKQCPTCGGRGFINSPDGTEWACPACNTTGQVPA